MGSGTRRVLQAVACIGLALPALWLAYLIAGELKAPGSQLGADPGEAVTDYLGTWALRMLWLALAITPLRRLLGWQWLAPLRRTAGLFAFGYVVAHVLAYLGFLKGFELAAVVEDLTERSYIVAGALAVAALVPLAITSTRGWRRRLGQRWLSLHRLVFVAAIAALVHLFWLTRDGYGEPLAYLLILALVLGERWLNGRRSQPLERVPRAASS